MKRTIKKNPNAYLEVKTRENKIRLEQEEKERWNKLLIKLKEEEENYEAMKQKLIEITKEKHYNERKEDSRFQKVEKVKLEHE